MKSREKTFREIVSGSPENMTEEEKKGMSKLFETLRELGKVCESYNIECNSKNTTNRLSKRFYQEHFIMSAILEAFFIKDEISFKELNQTIANYIPQEFIWDIPVAQINLVIVKMKRLGFIELVETENEYAPNFKITDDGAKAYQVHTFQTLATSSFFNYQTYHLNKKADRISKLMLIATIVSILVAILSVIVTICVTSK